MASCLQHNFSCNARLYCLHFPYNQSVMRLLITLFVGLFGFILAQAQTDPAIQTPIKDLFLAMEKGDSILLRSAFHTDVTLITVLEKEGKFTLRKETSINSFAKSIGTPHADVYYEPIWDVKTEQDGKFAQVWCKYAFYLGNKFSHCGVDTFQLIKTEAGWKIFYLADTRQKVGCSIPKVIVKKYSAPK